MATDITADPTSRQAKFSLRDEALASNRKSSSRLLQADAHKLRHFPVEFILATQRRTSHREDLESSTRSGSPTTQSELQDSSKLSTEGVDALPQANADSRNVAGAVSPAAQVSPQVQTTMDLETLQISDDDSASSLMLTDEELCDSADLQEDGQACLVAHAPSSTGNASPVGVEYHRILEAIDAPGTAERQSATDRPDADSADALSERDSGSIERVTISGQADARPEGSELFAVDTTGTEHCAGCDGPDEAIFGLSQTPKPEGSVTADATWIRGPVPYARTLDDAMTGIPAQARPAADADGARHLKHPRGGRRRSTANLRQAARQEEDDYELAVMIDYMENCQGEMADSDTSDGEEDPQTATESMFAQLLRGLGPEVGSDSDRAWADAEPLREADSDLDVSALKAIESASDDDSQNFSSDEDYDDHLELLIEQQMEEDAFDFHLGTSKYRSQGGRLRGAGREIVDGSLYREDFSIYDYRSDGHDASSSSDDSEDIDERTGEVFARDGDLGDSDKELRRALKQQWEKDKSKKASRKRDRQLMHAAGTIGKKAKRSKVRQAAPFGPGEVDDYNAKICHFVTGEEYRGIEQLPLPAMEKRLRKAVHIIAHAYGLQTKSTGAGKRRHPILYKTKHSHQLPSVFERDRVVIAAKRAVGSGQLATKRTSGRHGTKESSFAGAGGSTGQRLRDGDIVGGDAAELNHTNRGRTMLEKLGWTTGQGLGVHGNQGIATPLFATVKTTKYGLGS